MGTEPTPAPWHLVPVANTHRILGGPRNQVIANLCPTAAKVSLPNGLRMAAALDMFKALDSEERVRLHWEETKDLRFIKDEDALKFWEITERLLPELAAKCPPCNTLTEAEIRNYLAKEDPLPTTEGEWAYLRCCFYDTFCEIDGSVWSEAIEAATTGLRRGALAKARGEAVPAESEVA